MHRLSQCSCYDEIAAAVSAYQRTGGQRFSYLWGSRLRDLVLCGLAFLVAAPVVLAFAALIKLETPGPVFYKQIRVGQNGTFFTLYKLRSMVNDAEKDGPQWASASDSRVTRVGSFIRRTRIDELPQLFNILRGDMTIVGPRPERPEFVVQFQQANPCFVSRLQVKPGLTGWAQVNGGYNHAPDEKLAYDIYYIQNQSFLLDMDIILRTVAVIVTGEGAR